MAPAVDLQNLIIAFAFRSIMDGTVSSRDIPDTPFIESERRQIFFGAAIGIPTFFVRRDTENRFMRGILERCDHVRSSHRYPGYLRVYNAEYCRALVRCLKAEAADLIELFGMKETIDDLNDRLDGATGRQAAARLTKDILEGLGARTPLDVKGETFNGAAEEFYRNPLRLRQLSEALDLLEDELTGLASPSSPYHATTGRLLYGLASGDPLVYLRGLRNALMAETAPVDDILRLICAVLLTVGAELSAVPEPAEPFRETGT
jgi:hypothetical protein